ncbi:hypothetical protein U27_04127 [Candidatus Vecturithrix granuli]|uniref:Uncharacterized protein n=1 Tax=Vecturithrix granuli TaxID=1499967 RepID=A0A081BXV7_VECG1|nr:hypothetical protein U27_04127 [Candidatus Vecturithrix granuli]
MKIQLTAILQQKFDKSLLTSHNLIAGSQIFGVSKRFPHLFFVEKHLHRSACRDNCHGGLNLHRQPQNPN